MNKDEILLKAQEENKGKDLADKSARNDGSWIAYSVGVILIILVDTINGFVLHNVNRGADFALFSGHYAYIPHQQESYLGNFVFHVFGLYRVEYCCY